MKLIDLDAQPLNEAKRVQGIRGFEATEMERAKVPTDACEDAYSVGKTVGCFLERAVKREQMMDAQQMKRVVEGLTMIDSTQQETPASNPMTLKRKTN